MSQDTKRTEFEERHTRDDFERIVGEVQRQRQNATDYAGMAGQATKQAIENHGFNRKALTIHLQLRKLDSAARTAVVRSLLQYEDYDGAFDQIDAFDDLGTLATRLAARCVTTEVDTSAPSEEAETTEPGNGAEKLAGLSKPRGRRKSAEALDSLTQH